MRVGLYGIQGVYNFGCEAIVRGAFKFAKTIFPESQIVYFTFSESYDKEILNDLDLEIVPVKSDFSIFKRIINKVCKVIDFDRRFLMIDYNAVIDNVDIIISIGGDIYTIPQVFREQSKYPYYNPLVDFCERAIRKGKTIIVYGASVGPWGNYKKAIEYNIQALKKYKVILCREVESIDYLHSLGLDNVTFFPDPAFQIRKQITSVDKKYIGINLSPLSLQELYGMVDDQCIAKMATLIDCLYESTNINLLFIPHVLSHNEMDNDLWFMEKIREKMAHKDIVVFADSSNGFLGLKEYIAQCFVVASARMHCAINAIDENVPAIFLTYSQKSVGMCKYIYGNEKYLVDLKKIDTDLVDAIHMALKEHEKISEYLVKRNKEIENYYKENISDIRKLVFEKKD